MLTPLGEAESPADVPRLSAAAGVEERMGTRDVARNGISFSRAGVRKVGPPSDDLSGVSASPGSLQVERRELEAGEDEEEEIRGEEWLDACEEEDVGEEEEEEEVRAESGTLGGSSSEDGMHSHVSRSENLE